MLGLRDLEWVPTYSTDKNDLVRTFYLPCLRHATAYWRAVGYFSSSVLALISPAIEEFYAKNGKMRLIASPAMSEKDQATIRAAYQQRVAAEELQEDETVIECLRRYLDPNRVKTDEERLRLRLLAGMIRDGLLDIRIAVRVRDDCSVVLYHEKIGVFEDIEGDFVTFNGSPNETWNGWVSNAESFALHRSWAPEAPHAQSERALFVETWTRQRSGVAVFELNERVTSTLFEQFPPIDPARAAREGKKSFHLRGYKSAGPSDLGLTVPDFIAEHGLRTYQRDCIESWAAAGHRGTFALATGTGKTVIALSAAQRFAKEQAKERRSTLVLVVVPTTELADQWRRNAREFGFETSVCNSAARNWKHHAELALSALQGSIPRVQCVILTADTMTGTKWMTIAKVIESLDSGLLVIGDEMHSLGTSRRLSGLPDRNDSTVGRIGLSATPRRHNDEQGTEALLDYFGDVLVTISITEAISLGALCPYTYDPIVARLSHSEQAEFDRLSKEIGKAWHSAGDEAEKFYRLAGKYLTQRVSLLSHAEEKTAKGLQLAKSYGKHGYQIVYTGEGTHPLTQVSQIDYLLGELREAKVRTEKFVYQTETDQRNVNLQMFRRGDLDVLVAMRCLDEGIDIPEARRGIILASTQNPRQFVQRRGRLLRRAPGKQNAELVDVLCLPSALPDKSSPAYAAERDLVSRELTRALELAEAAINGRSAPPEALSSIMAEYDLMHLAASYGDDTTWQPRAQ